MIYPHYIINTHTHTQETCYSNDCQCSQILYKSSDPVHKFMHESFSLASGAGQLGRGAKGGWLAARGCLWECTEHREATPALSVCSQVVSVCHSDQSTGYSININIQY